MTSELSELRAELWRTRDDLERMKSSSNSRTPTKARAPRSHPSPRIFDRRRHNAESATDKSTADRRKGRYDHQYPLEDDKRQDRHLIAADSAAAAGGGDVKESPEREGKSRRSRGSGVESGPTSPPTSRESVVGSESNGAGNTPAVARDGSGSGHRRIYDSSPGVGAETEATLCNLEFEGVAFKNWTEEASSIAVRLIEEVKALRWERETWRNEQATAARAFAELRTRADALEGRLIEAEAEEKRSRDTLAHAQQAERQQSRATERAKADLRAAREQAGALHAHELGLGAGTAGGLREQLRREREGTDALQRRLDTARTKLAGYERERKEWRVWKARLEEMRRSWGNQLKKVAKKMRAKSEENAALKVRVAETERARDRADAEAFRLRDNLDRLTEQRDNLLLGATRAGHASSPADALAELLAAAAAGVATGAGTGTRASTANTNLGRDRGIDGINRGLRLGGAWGELFPGEGGHGGGNDGNGGGARRQGDREGGGGESGSAGGALEVSAEELERARAEAKLAKVAVQQERLKRDGAMREKDEAVRQLHRLMGAARRAVGKRDNKLRSSRLETEVVWNALTEAVREE